MVNGSQEPAFDHSRHVKYWTRCVKTYLPSQYTSNDSNRMYLGYFILSALDLLNVTDSVITLDERQSYIRWIYHCQHPQGGFRMWPGTNFGPRANDENAKWDPANMPATYFALASLLALGDELELVNKHATLEWLQQMQRDDGSFGEILVAGQIEGGHDPRFGYCAAGIRYILRAQRFTQPNSNTLMPDIDVVRLTRCIAVAQSYEGGFADAAFHEPHAGYTFCSLGALALVQRRDLTQSNRWQTIDVTAVQRWLVDRQTDVVYPDARLDSEFSNTTRPVEAAIRVHQDVQSTVLPHRHADFQSLDVKIAGMNGRLNKVADTCYAWWVSASLHMLDQAHLINQQALRRYLLQLTQHPYMGGFSKFPEDRIADIYHSFMGLTALSLCSTAEQRKIDGIKDWDAEMCISKVTRAVIDS